MCEIVEPTYMFRRAPEREERIVEAVEPLRAWLEANPGQMVLQSTWTNPAGGYAYLWSACAAPPDGAVLHG